MRFFSRLRAAWNYLLRTRPPVHKGTYAQRKAETTARLRRELVERELRSAVARAVGVAE